ncbi:sulfite exporter TauE/SafE family protein [Thermaerobacter composti]|uniref:Probable membrane transporter protein n=1 Tax=Thermaerobacter composti TaxID=554949 RepID=A0ABZ0QT14_9FIRM|nr:MULTISPECIES: sulfite exporter TauE/SafE family protein [Thermaerobacter]WPD19822.1 sulfite exporter TauE/SafE family protein [Thermaerobacter composti]
MAPDGRDARSGWRDHRRSGASTPPLTPPRTFTSSARTAPTTASGGGPGWIGAPRSAAGPGAEARRRRGRRGAPAGGEGARQAAGADRLDRRERPTRRRLSGWAPWVAGVVVGGVNGLLGVGGGTLLVPALVYWFGVPDHRAHGTSILVVGLTSLISAGVYATRGMVDPSLAAQVAAGGVIGAALGARWMAYLRPRGLRRLYGAFLLALGLRMLIWG